MNVSTQLSRASVILKEQIRQSNDSTLSSQEKAELREVAMDFYEDHATQIENPATLWAGIVTPTILSNKR
jgi:hypothetical protein